MRGAPGFSTARRCASTYAPRSGWRRPRTGTFRLALGPGLDDRVHGIVAMLAEDVRLAMPPMLTWYDGPAAVRAALTAGPLTHRWRLLLAFASGQPAFGCYRWHEQRARFVGEGLDVITMRDGRITAITAFLITDLQTYGLPSEISS